MATLQRLTAIANSQGLNVVLVDDIKFGFIGCNDLAAKVHSIEMPPMTIWLKRGIGLSRTIRTLRHEIIERGKMALGWTYQQAHHFATYHEDDPTILQEAQYGLSHIRC